MTKDTLILLKTPFKDAAYPGQEFYCPSCVVIEGIIASFPQLRDVLNIEYADYPRPRQSVIAVTGEENQSLPVLIMSADIAPPPNSAQPQYTSEHKGIKLAQTADTIIQALQMRYGIAVAHP